MPPRDPAKTALNKEIAAMTEQLELLQRHVMKAFGVASVSALHGKIGGKNAEFIDVQNEVILSPGNYFALWLQGLLEAAKHRTRSISDPYYLIVHLMKTDPKVKEYITTFAKRTYLRESGSLARKRPSLSDAEIWMGQNHAEYGLLVTPRFRSDWENDKSEIRRFKPRYFTVGHVLETGLCVPGDEDRMPFADVEAYLVFFKNVLVRATASVHQKRIAQLYCDFVRGSEKPELVPLLIPEFRYAGREPKHQYRLDFTVIDPFTMRKVGFELSPWSTHGKLTGVKSKTQAAVNKEASDNFDREMAKHKAYFKKYDVYTHLHGRGPSRARVHLCGYPRAPDSTRSGAAAGDPCARRARPLRVGRSARAASALAGLVRRTAAFG